MPYETLVGLDVRDDVMYDAYRAAMKPILDRFGGGFRYDFRVGEVLRSETENPINRVFAIYFPDKVSKAAFFADPEYQQVRATYFAPSVAAVTTIAEYER